MVSHDDMTNYAERRVLALLLVNPEPIPADLKAEDFYNLWHRQIFKALAAGNDVHAMDLADEVKAFLLTLDEDWTPQNLGVFASIVKRAADQRRFAEGVGRLRA